MQPLTVSWEFSQDIFHKNYLTTVDREPKPSLGPLLILPSTPGVLFSSSPCPFGYSRLSFLLFMSRNKFYFICVTLDAWKRNGENKQTFCETLWAIWLKNKKNKKIKSTRRGDKKPKKKCNINWFVLDSEIEGNRGKIVVAGLQTSGEKCLQLATRRTWQRTWKNTPSERNKT